MADENMYDEMADESSPTTSEEQSVSNDNNDTKDENKSEETDDQLALVPKHFFKTDMKPGDREMVEVVESYDGELSIRCVYGEGDKDEEEPEEEGMESAPVEAEEDSMMA